MWSYHYGIEDLDERAFDLVELPSTDFVIAGEQEQSGKIHAHLFAIKSDGTTVHWSKIYYIADTRHDEYFRSVTLNTTGEVNACGSSLTAVSPTVWQLLLIGQCFPNASVFYSNPEYSHFKLADIRRSFTTDNLVIAGSIGDGPAFTHSNAVMLEVDANLLSLNMRTFKQGDASFGHAMILYPQFLA